MCWDQALAAYSEKATVACGETSIGDSLAKAADNAYVAYFQAQVFGVLDQQKKDLVVVREGMLSIQEEMARVAFKPSSLPQIVAAVYRKGLRCM